MRHRGFLGQFRQIRQATGIFNIAGALQEFGQGDNIQRLALTGEALHCAKDQAVILSIEIGGRNHFRDLVEPAVVEHQAAQYRLLCFHRMGRHLDTTGFEISTRGLQIGLGHEHIFSWTS